MKKIFLLSILLFQLNFVFGQTVGSVVKSKTIYSGSGIIVSYTVTYYGVGDCNNNTNGGLKKYRIDFNARNNSNTTVKLVGSRVDIDDNVPFGNGCRSGVYILFGSYPGFEDFGTLVPNENVNATFYAYMLQNSNDFPYITSNIIPLFQKEQQSQNTPKSNQNTITTSSNQNTESQTYQNIQEAITKFNSLINQAANADQQVATRIQTDVQNALKSDRNTESFKLTMVNNGIRDLENLIARKSNNSTNQTNNSNQQTTQQNDLSEYNRSKAEMEQKLAEKNAEITRQNQENARLGQIWNNAIKAGVDAHNSGNYTEAKNQFTIAINNSSNETNRQNAQNYYNKSVDAEKRNVKIKAAEDLIKLTMDVSKSYQEAKIKENEEEAIYQAKLKKIKDDHNLKLDKQKEIETEKSNLYFSNINYFREIVSIKNTEFGEYIDYIVSKLENMNQDKFTFINIGSVEVNNQKKEYQNKRASLEFKNGEKLLLVSLEFSLFDSYESKHYTFERKIDFRSKQLSVPDLINIADTIFYSMFEKTYESETNNYVAGLINLPSTEILGKTNKESFKNSKYKGWKNTIDKKPELKKDENITSYLYNGNLYSRGLGNGLEDIKKAIYWYEKAAELGESRHYLSIYNCYKKLNNIEKSTYWLEKSAETNNTEAYFYLGNLNFEKNDFKKAIDYYISSYNFENNIKEKKRKAKFIADIFIDKNKLNDNKNALIWLINSVNIDYNEMLMDYDDILLKIGMMYEFGDGTEKDFNEAKLWYLKAIEKNNDRAYYRLSKLYETGGPNLEKDKKEAKKILELFKSKIK